MNLKNLLASFFIIISLQSTIAQHSVAREWSEVLLSAIRDDLARPTVHSRNLFHTSIAMYDAWASYDTIARPFLLGNTVGGYECVDYDFPMPPDIEAAREEAISYACYRLLNYRFSTSVGADSILPRIENLFNDLGYDPLFTGTDYTSGNPAALGNYIGQQLVLFGLQDGANETANYANQNYQPTNPPLVIENPGNPNIIDPNLWQPLTLDIFIDQSGNVLFETTPDFLSPEWGNVTPFAMDPNEEMTSYKQPGGFSYNVWNDPGAPPYLDTMAMDNTTEFYKWGFSLVAAWSSHLDPADTTMIDISPASLGNIPTDQYPQTWADYPDFYDFENGGDPSNGRTMNPSTGLPYVPQMVKRADYARVLAEFWADGPDSETPPGHWFTLLNYVNDHPDLVKRHRGDGELLGDLEWDVKGYLMLGGAMHDAAISAWSIKGYYDYIRPVSAIRCMAGYGQSTDPALANYSPLGIPLVPGFIELVEPGDILAFINPFNIGKIKIKAWRGPNYIFDETTDVAGVDWIMAEGWYPYQRPSFVTPPFAGYVSGHSTFSRAAAEVLTLLTGDEYFPGGMGEFLAPANDFLVFENGPSEDILLQWATYRDASDQTSLSRIWGGIHPPADDIPGRLIGEQVGINAFELSETYFFRDDDADGYYHFEDCDDNDPLVNPGATEICDGIDNNCDGQINEDLTIYTYYKDADNDSYGDAAVSIDTCQSFAPPTFVTDFSDCDDTDPAVHPAATEICDGIDNNCDGAINEDLASFTYYKDADNDGFGDAAISIDTCQSFAPPTFVTNDQDCNDNNAAINPSVSEICDDIDQDCNGSIDDNLPLNTYYLDSDNDGYGDEVFSIQVCYDTPPATYIDNATDCNDNDAGMNPGLAEIADNGIDEDCSGIDLFKQTKFFPNPVTGTLTVHYDYDGAVFMRMFSADGRLIDEGDAIFVNNSFELEMGHLPKGIYMIALFDQDGGVILAERIAKD